MYVSLYVLWREFASLPSHILHVFFLFLGLLNVMMKMKTFMIFHFYFVGNKLKIRVMNSCVIKGLSYH